MKGLPRSYLTPLKLAAQLNRIECAETLLINGVNVNGFNGGHCYNTPLHIAARKGHVQMVKFLLKYHADVNETTSGGNTALEIAKCKGHTEIVKLLDKS